MSWLAMTNMSYRNSNKTRSGLVSLAGIEYESWDANIENRGALVENQDVVIENQVSILDSCEDPELSVNLLSVL